MSSENISSSKKFQLKRERGGDECALIKIRARAMAAAASGWTSLVDLARAVTAGRYSSSSFARVLHVCMRIRLKKLT